MNPALSAFIGGFLRWGLTILAGLLVEHGIWTQAEATTYVASAVLALLALGWELWSKYHGRIKLLSVLEVAQMTENQAKKLATTGSTPPVSTHPDSVPLSPPT